MADNLSNEQIEQIQSAIFTGRRIDAVKLYRQASGKGLSEALAFVNALQNELYKVSPERFTVDPTKATGCGMPALLLVALVIIIATVLILLR